MSSPTPSSTSNHPSTPPARIPVGILGATGTVGQRLLLLLASHPLFALKGLGASERSEGKLYPSIVRWKQTLPIPDIALTTTLRPCTPHAFRDCHIVFSGLDHDIAGPIETSFRAAGMQVFSNAKNFRRDPAVPLVVPLVNSDHLHILPTQIAQLPPPAQTTQAPRPGYIVTNANCSTTGLVVPLAALERALGPIDAVLCTTLQAISGAGYPGMSAMDIVDNVVPYIPAEEEKIEWETSKILGTLAPDQRTFVHRTLAISASANRVAVMEGHTLCVSVRFATRPPPSVAQVMKAMEEYTCLAQELNCPSAPKNAIHVHQEIDRPQPRLDRDFQAGAGVCVGRIRPCPVLDIKFVVLINNVAAGAATGAVLNAELATLMPGLL